MIGVFDSGSGGLTVLRAIRDRLKNVDVLYFGDIKNAPYGGKSREELTDLTVNAMKFLQGRGATSIVSACNSVSASLAVSLYDAFDLAPQHLIEMVGPTVAYFRGSTARLALAATPATIQSGIYQSGFRMIGRDIVPVAIPDLAGAIEFGAPREEMSEQIRGAFAGVDIGACDALVLACTHYPLVADVFTEVLGSKAHLFDPAEAVAERVERQLWPREAGDGALHFAVTKDSAPFREFVAKLFPKEKYDIEVLQ